jgi:hypothetical protein
MNDPTGLPTYKQKYIHNLLDKKWFGSRDSINLTLLTNLWHCLSDNDDHINLVPLYNKDSYEIFTSKFEVQVQQ